MLMGHVKNGSQRSNFFILGAGASGHQTVHSLLEKHPDVVSFALDHPEYGDWGATIGRLKNLPQSN
jgi:hypothetical protein